MTIDEGTQLANLFREEHFWDSPDEAVSRARYAWNRAVPAVIKRAAADKVGEDEFDLRLWKLKEVIQGFCYNALQTAPQPSNPKVAWVHQKIDIIRSGEPIILLRDATGCAAAYVSEKEIQANFLDWCFLESLVFAEIQAFSNEMMSTRFRNTAVNWAWGFANSSWSRYYIFRIAFFLLSIAFRALLAYGAFELFKNGWLYAALAIVALLTFDLLAQFVSIPWRWKKSVANRKLLQKMCALYQQLEGPTISPRRLKEQLDDAALAGVVFDGAVFTLVDRMIARDPTAFVL